ncbi:hypothetical protein [Embleya sp. NPDC059237]|uniref:hypothetical protein n=1 Tax=Embleya sp. NPDC059237 TaxID=3346784 RepID=UPI0036887942
MNDGAAGAGGGYTLIGPDGRPYRSATAGTLGGTTNGRLYGRLDCRSALRAIARGGYVASRVFFATEADAVAAGFRPCAVCLPAEYARWKGCPPAPHTEAELADLLRKLAGRRTLAIGHGRDRASTAAAHALAAAWPGEVVSVVSWPEQAASWLRPALRLTAQAPDAWVVAGAARGWAGMRERLLRSTDWDPERTYGFASLADAIGDAGEEQGVTPGFLSYAPIMAERTLVPDDFVIPPPPSTPSFRLEPLAARHNEADLAAWTSSIDHIRATPGFAGRHWPPPEGMAPADNLRDLVKHADDFTRRVGFTYTVLAVGGAEGAESMEGVEDVIGCVYIYPDRDDPSITNVRSWVRADRADLDAPLHHEVSAWLAARWPFEHVVYAPR